MLRGTGPAEENRGKSLTSVINYPPTKGQRYRKRRRGVRWKHRGESLPRSLVGGTGRWGQEAIILAWMHIQAVWVLREVREWEAIKHHASRGQVFGFL